MHTAKRLDPLTAEKLQSRNLLKQNNPNSKQLLQSASDPSILVSENGLAEMIAMKKSLQNQATQQLQTQQYSDSEKKHSNENDNQDKSSAGEKALNFSTICNYNKKIYGDSQLRTCVRMIFHKIKFLSNNTLEDLEDFHLCFYCKRTSCQRS